MFTTKSILRVFGNLISTKIIAPCLFGGILSFCTVRFLLPLLLSDSVPFGLQIISGIPAALTGFAAGVLIFNAISGLFKPNSETSGISTDSVNDAISYNEKRQPMRNILPRRNSENPPLYSDKNQISTLNSSDFPKLTERKMDRKEKESQKPWLVYIFTALFLLSLLFIGVLAVYKYYDFPKTTISNLSKSDFNNSEQEVKRQQEFDATIGEVIQRKPSELREALNKYKTNPDIELILRDRLEDRNIGGAITVAVTNLQYNPDNGVYKTPEELGFKRIIREDSLVERAIHKEIEIINIYITPALEDHQFNISLRLKNLTPTDLKYYIPKGQIFENKDYILSKFVVKNSEKNYPSKFTQSNATSDSDKDDKRHIPPMAEDTIQLTAFCINKGFQATRGDANITIYELVDKDFFTPSKLYDLLKKRNEA